MGTTRPSVPSSEAVESHYAHSAERRRSGRRIVWGILVGFVLLLMLTPLVFYLAWQARGRAILRGELAKIKSRGEPITTAEMAAWYAVPQDKRDITPIWLAAIEPFDSPAFNASCTALPIVGSGPALPPEDQPLPAAQEQAIRDFLQLHQDKLAAVRAAAQEEGEVRYPRDFRKGIAAPLSDAQTIRSVVRVFDLEFELLDREDNFDAAFQNLQARVATGETLKEEPLIVSMLIRIAVQHLTLLDVRRLAENRQLTDAQLHQLQQLIRTVDIHGQLPATLLGERQTCYHAFHLSMKAVAGSTSVVATNTANEEANFTRDTTHDVNDVKRPEDCAMALSLLTEMHDASEGPPHEAFAIMGDLGERLKELHSENLSINRVRYAMTSLLLPAIEAVAAANARSVAIRDLTDAGLAVRRYHLRHGQVPATMAELVPDFLPRIHLDSHDGQPLRMKHQANGVLLYSIGRDLRDDGGATSQAQEPDIAIEINFPP